MKTSVIACVIAGVVAGTALPVCHAVQDSTDPNAAAFKSGKLVKDTIAPKKTKDVVPATAPAPGGAAGSPPVTPGAAAATPPNPQNAAKATGGTNP